MKTAIVIGATGVTGRGIVGQLLQSEQYDRVKVFARRPLDVQHPKIDMHLVDFNEIDDWKQLVTGDDLFSALGTTRKKAGGQDEQYRVDYTLQADIIEAAARQGVGRLFLVTTPHADSKSSFFYLRMKGELEIFAAYQGFRVMAFFKPTIISGDRPDERNAEKLGIFLSRRLSAIVPAARNLRPISGDELGKAMVNSACNDLPLGLHIYEPRDIFELLDA